MYLTDEQMATWRERYLLDQKDNIDFDKIPSEVRNQIRDWATSNKLVQTFENNCSCNTMEAIFPGEGSRLFKHFVETGYNANKFSREYLTPSQKNIFLVFIFTKGKS